MDALGVPGIVLMENAAIGCMAALRELAGDAWPAVRIEIVCGSGNNGGDGYAIARQCLVAGATPRLRPFSAPRAGSDAERNAKMCAALGILSVPFVGTDGDEGDEPDERLERVESDAHDAHDEADEELRGDLLVDALLGTGLDRAAEANAARVIGAMNRFNGPILSVDLPSGLDADTGKPLGAAVRATVTCTMVAPKRGFEHKSASEWTGRVIVVPIGVPGPA